MPSPMEAVTQPHGFLWNVIWANFITVVVLNLVSGAPHVPSLQTGYCSDSGTLVL
jgi:hypothetical protein